MIRHVVFDLDGTLVDSCGACVEILSAMRAERGCHAEIDADAARPLMSAGGEAMVAALLGEACVDPSHDLAEFRGRYAAYRTPRDALFPHVAEGLAAMSGAGLRLAVCSNKPQGLCDAVLRDTGIAPLFDVVVGGRAGAAPKPSPRLLHMVLDGLRAGPRECLFVGDSELDHQAAEAAGMPFLFVGYGYAAPGWSAGGVPTYDCFGALSADVILRAVARREAHHA